MQGEEVFSELRIITTVVGESDVKEHITSPLFDMLDDKCGTHGGTTLGTELKVFYDSLTVRASVNYIVTPYGSDKCVFPALLTVYTLMYELDHIFKCAW
jgi:hypothetical protein